MRSPHPVSKGTVLYRQRNPVEIFCAAWSPDGGHIATGDAAGRITIWQAESGQERLIYETQTGDITSLAWSPDGRHIAFGDTLGIVHLWDVVEHRSIAVASAGLRSLHRIVWWKPDPISGVTWLPDGTSFIVACRQSVQIRRATTARRLTTYLDPFEDDQRYMLYQVDWSPDRQRMVSVGGYVVSNEPDPVVYEGCMYMWKTGNGPIAEGAGN